MLLVRQSAGPREGSIWRQKVTAQETALVQPSGRGSVEAPSPEWVGEPLAVHRDSKVERAVAAEGNPTRANRRPSTTPAVAAFEVEPWEEQLLRERLNEVRVVASPAPLTVETLPM